MIKYKDIKDLEFKELVKKRSLQTKELFEVRMKHKMGQMSSPLDLRKIRRDIAKISTAITLKLKDKKNEKK